MKRFFIDITLAQQLGLQGAELLCFFALQALCATTCQPSVHVSYSELARLSGCGCDTTALRAVSALSKRGLVKVENGFFTILQNAASSLQIAAFSEKESTKEKEINKENKLVSYNKGNQPTKDFKKEEFIIPSQSQVMEYAQQHNISATVAQKWYLYWEQHSWAQPNGQPMGRWQPCLEGFALRENNCSPQLRNFEKMTHGGQSLNPQGSLTYLEQQEEIHRQIKAEERAKREADWAERENNRAAAAAFFARHPDWLSHT